jgi:hypothetical protein
MKQEQLNLELRDPKEIEYMTKLRRFAHVIDHERCLTLPNIGPSHEGVEIFQGRNVCCAFHNVVDFGDQDRSLRWLVGHADESAGGPSKTKENGKWFDQL